MNWQNVSTFQQNLLNVLDGCRRVHWTHLILIWMHYDMVLCDILSYLRLELHFLTGMALMTLISILPEKVKLIGNCPKDLKSFHFIWKEMNCLINFKIFFIPLESWDREILWLIHQNFHSSDCIFQSNNKTLFLTGPFFVHFNCSIDSNFRTFKVLNYFDLKGWFFCWSAT